MCVYRVCVGLGVVVDGMRLEVRPRAERISRLRNAISVITSGTPIPGHLVEIIIGHIVSICLIQRYSLSALDFCYKFVQAHRWSRMPDRRSVVSELKVVSGLLLLICVSLISAPSNRAFALDDSERGYAVTQRFVSSPFPFLRVPD